MDVDFMVFRNQLDRVKQIMYELIRQKAIEERILASFHIPGKTEIPKSLKSSARGS